MTGTSGEVKSPNYPSNYDNNMDVNFPLEVASGSAIELTFTDFDIEDHVSCIYDYVQVCIIYFHEQATRLCCSAVAVLRVRESQ